MHIESIVGEYEKYGMYIQGIIIGLITFSIPFLWNVYKSIMDIKNQTVGDKINNILTKEYYEKKNKSFYRYLLLPIGSIFSFGLILFPLINGIAALIMILISFGFVLCMTGIYEYIEEKCYTDLKKYLIESRDYEKLAKAFSELWQIKDDDIYKEYLMDIRDVYKIYSLRIEEMIKGGKEKKIDLSVINKMLEYFSDNLNNRNLHVLFISKDVFPKILEWSYKAGGLYKLQGDTEKGSWLYSRNILYELIDELTKEALKGPYVYSIFDNYDEHIKAVISSAKEDDSEYIRDILSRLCDVFFANINESEQKYLIWKSYFPEDWRITENNLKNPSNKVAEIFTEKYCGWAFDRIINSKGDFDAELDEVSRNLLPETDPIDWAKLLIFTLVLFSSNDYDSALKQPVSFGMFGRITPGIIDMEGLKEDLEKQHKSTLSLLKTMFPKIYSDSNLKAIISKLENLKYEEDTKEESKRKRLLKMFINMEGMKKGNDEQHQ